MADQSRIEELRRRVQRDPASIAFAQLAEECRRAGAFQEAIDICQTGLAIHPGYVSARVTLGRALFQLDHLDQAQAELERVLSVAPENLAAIRGLAQIHQRRGAVDDALAQYRVALSLAPNDPELEQAVNHLSRDGERSPAPALYLAPTPVRTESTDAAGDRDRAMRTITALEHWLAAIHVPRSDHSA